MMERAAVGLATAACAAVLAASFPCGAAAQSYPKLMVNGHGLALTRLAIQERAGSNWIATPTLRQGADYRLVMRFTNFYPNVYSYGGGVRDIIRISYSAQHAFASFYPSDRYQGSGQKWLNGYDEAGLGPTRSRTYYQHFRWIGPPMPTPLAPFRVTFSGGEVNLLPKQTGDLRPGG